MPKAGTNSPCMDAYFQQIHDSFNRFDDPLVYTPGDNEWTDCHVAFKNNGLFTPTERLQAARSLFFPVPGQTLGVHKRFVLSQAIDPRNRAYVENVLFLRSRVVFAALNVTGSNDDLAPWGTPLPDDATNFPSQAQERASRLQANLAWLHDAFLAATVTHAPGIVLMMQADMWDITAKLNGFDEMVRQIGVEAVRFRQPVLVAEACNTCFSPCRQAGRAGRDPRLALPLDQSCVSSETIAAADRWLVDDRPAWTEESQRAVARLHPVAVRSPPAVTRSGCRRRPR